MQPPQLGCALGCAPPGGPLAVLGGGWERLEIRSGREMVRVLLNFPPFPPRPVPASSLRLYLPFSLSCCAPKPLRAPHVLRDVNPPPPNGMRDRECLEGGAELAGGIGALWGGGCW